MEKIGSVVTLLQLFISFCTVITLIYGFAKFTSKPHDDLRKDVEELKKWKESTDRELHADKIKFQRQDDANRVTQSALLALIDKEIKDSIAEGKEVSTELNEARKNLYTYLTTA